MTLDNMNLDPKLRYKKYLELLRMDNRMWSLKHHAMYLLCNNAIALLAISFIFRRKFMPDLVQFHSMRLNRGILKSYKPRFFYVCLFYASTFFCLYYYSRFYLYDEAYENYYGPQAISNKDFLDLYDSIMLRKRMKEGI